jgi:hypothetical protein
VQAAPRVRRGDMASRAGSTATASIALPLQRLAGNRAVCQLLSAAGTHVPTGVVPPGQAGRAGSLAVQRCGGHPCPPEGCEEQEPVQRDAMAFDDRQAARLARYPGAALQQWARLTQDQRDSVLWKMIAAYGPDFGSDFLNYANGSKAPHISTEITNDPTVTPKTLTAKGYRQAGDAGGIPAWVHPSGHEIRLLSKPADPPKPAEPAEPAPGCADPDAGDACMESDDEDACKDCCDQQYGNDEACRRTCRMRCNFKL